jgi:endo-1,4-beta-xylanase
MNLKSFIHRSNLIVLVAMVGVVLMACQEDSSAGASPPSGTPPVPPSRPEVTQAPKPLPAGGADVIGANTFAALQGGSSDAVKLEPITVQGQSFTQGWRVTGLKPLEQPYFSQLSANNTLAIAKDDVMVVQFWARNAGTTPAQTEFVFEMSGDPYEKSVSVNTLLNPQWTLYSVPFKAARDFAVGAGSAHFRLGYANQSFELGGVVLKNYARSQRLEDLPFSGFSYAGRERNAPWRVAAAARIEQLRKADLKLKIVDSSGNPVSGVSIKLEMTRHAFPFGTAVDAGRLLGTGSDSVKYKQTILQLFNRVVLENDLKWPGWEGYSRDRALEALKFFAANKIPVRGHNLIWPCEDNYCLPTDVPPLFSDPAKLRARIDAHLSDILGATKGQLVEWDVVNEPSANKRIAKVLGEDEMAAWYKRAKTLEPNARLFVNDYGNLGEGNLDTEYKRIIGRLLDLGAPVEGIGLQAHFGFNLPPPEDLQSRLEAFGKFGLPLAVTEFDVNIRDEQLQADYLRDFLTVAFSNQHVTSFLMWGFWAGQHWLPDAALYRQDWSLKPNGQVFKDLLFKTWWTSTSGSSDTTGRYGARGFMGEYKLTVTAGGKTVTQNLTLNKSSPETTITLP